jgi:hypothetical protein
MDYELITQLAEEIRGRLPQDSPKVYASTQYGMGFILVGGENGIILRRDDLDHETRMKIADLVNGPEMPVGGSRIVAFCGAQGSGKSTAAEALKGVGWLRMSFADPLYDMMSALLGCDARSLDKKQPLDALGGKTLRQGLQLLGTEWGRDLINRNIWTMHMHNRILANPGRCVVIDDLRFENEFVFLRSTMEAKVVLIDRPGVRLPISHASEADWRSFRCDHTLTNQQMDEWEWVQFVRRSINSRDFSCKGS